MEFIQINKQIIEIQKMSFSNCYDAFVLLQDQATSVMSTAIQQNAWLPKEGQEFVQSWIDTYRQESQRFKALVDNGFSNMEKYFAVEKKVKKPAEKSKAKMKKEVAKEVEQEKQ